MDNLKILAREAKAANGMKQTNSEVLLPAKLEQVEELAKLSIKYIKPENKILHRFRLPSHLKLVANGSDPRHKQIIDVGKNNKHILGVFLKDSGYDYYGYVNICKTE